MPTTPRSSCWPTAEQTLLLRAALLRDNKAVEAWRQWRANADLETLDRGSLRLLPLLYGNLRRHGVDDAAMERFKGIYRFTWSKNQMLFHTMEDLLSTFHRAGIPTLVFKGAALVLLYYRDPGLRPMDDFDVLVPTERGAEAIRLLQSLGWKRPSGLPENVRIALHGRPFRQQNGAKVDLHWHLMPECIGTNADDDFWAAKATTRFGDVAVHVLNPTDELLNICIHGVKISTVPPLRWVADAMTILEAAGSSLDWSRLGTQAERRRLAVRLGTALQYLHDEMGAPVPREALSRLDGTYASRLERIDFQVVTDINNSIHPLRRLCHHYLNYMRQFDRDTPNRSPVAFLTYLKNRWRLNHLWEIPSYAVSMWLLNVWKTMRDGRRARRRRV